jgi:hypothetical protein
MMSHNHPVRIAAFITATAMLATALAACPVTVTGPTPAPTPAPMPAPMPAPVAAPVAVLTITDMTTGTVTDQAVYPASALDTLMDAIDASPAPTDAVNLTPATDTGIIDMAPSPAPVAKRFTPAQRTLIDKLTALAASPSCLTRTAHPYTPALLATVKALASRGIVTHERDGGTLYITLYITLTLPAAAA